MPDSSGSSSIGVQNRNTLDSILSLSMPLAYGFGNSNAACGDAKKFVVSTAMPYSTYGQCRTISMREDWIKLTTTRPVITINTLEHHSFRVL